VPFVPAEMLTFNEHYELSPEFQFGSLEYENACNSDVVRALLGPMSGDLTAVGFLSAPYAGVLRFAEGIDALRNLALSGVNTTTERQRGAAIVCGVAQFGGVLWMAVVLIVTAGLCICAPLGSLCCLRCYRAVRRTAAAKRRREQLIDEVLARAARQGGEETDDENTELVRNAEGA